MRNVTEDLLKPIKLRAESPAGLARLQYRLPIGGTRSAFIYIYSRHRLLFTSSEQLV